MAYMPYTTNPQLPRVRGEAVKLVRLGWRMRAVARHLGYEPSTIMRWVRKGMQSSKNNIPTESSRPNHHPRELPDDTVAAILRYRKKHRRCSEVIHHLLKQDGIVVSLSSVKRTLKRHGLLKSRSPWQKTSKSPGRPEVASPGDLVQMDTIHIHAITGERFYIYTLLDVHSRWAFAEVTERINTRRSLAFLKKAKAAAPFPFKMLQSDHGSEFSKFFRLHAGAHRHSRVRRPNDNGHLERFNRTIQEEGFRDLPEDFQTYRRAVKQYIPFYNEQRPHLALHFLSPVQVLRSYCLENVMDIKEWKRRRSHPFATFGGHIIESGVEEKDMVGYPELLPEGAPRDPLPRPHQEEKKPAVETARNIAEAVNLVATAK